MKWRKFWRWVGPNDLVRDLRLIPPEYRKFYRMYFYKSCGHALGALLLAQRKGHLYPRLPTQPHTAPPPAKPHTD